MSEQQSRQRLSRRLKIAHMLESWTPPPGPVSDEIQLTDQHVKRLTAREQKSWQRIRAQLGSDIISISRVRSVLTPADQDLLYRILQKALKRD